MGVPDASRCPLIRIRSAAVDLWVAFARLVADAAFGARAKILLNDLPPPDDCADLDVVTDLRRCLLGLVGMHTMPISGALDYAAIQADPDYELHALRRACLMDFDPARLSPGDERRAFWINLYNTLAIDTVLRVGEHAGVRARFGRFRWFVYESAGFTFRWTTSSTACCAATAGPRGCRGRSSGRAILGAAT